MTLRLSTMLARIMHTASYKALMLTSSEKRACGRCSRRFSIYRERERGEKARSIPNVFPGVGSSDVCRAMLIMFYISERACILCFTQPRCVSVISNYQSLLASPYIWKWKIFFILRNFVGCRCLFSEKKQVFDKQKSLRAILFA